MMLAGLEQKFQCGRMKNGTFLTDEETGITMKKGMFSAFSMVCQGPLVF